MLDTHDGIGVADVEAARGNDGSQGLLTPDEIDTLVKTIHQRSRGESRIASGSAASNVDASQINCTFYDALGRRDSDTSSHARFSASYRESRRSTTSACSPVATTSSCSAAPVSGATSIATTTRRMNCEHELTRPVVQSLLALLRIRNTHPAFQGTFDAPRIAGRQDRARLDERRGVRSPGCEPHRNVRIDHVLESRSTVRRRRGMARSRGGTGMTRRRHHVAQHGGRQDAHLSHVRHVRDDDRLGRHHHSRSHQDVSAVADCGRNVSVRDDDRNRAGGSDARATCRSPRSPAHDRHRPHRCSQPPASSSPRETRSCSSR